MKHVTDFMEYLKTRKPLYFKAVDRCYHQHVELFEELAECMLEWASGLLGKNYLDILSDGYVYFVNDVNRSQLKYQKAGKYENKSYTDVYKKVYNNSDYMNLYHWGVFVTTFSWEHHLRLYEYFNHQFISRLSDRGEFLDLGTGSGIWSFLALRNKREWRALGIDISDYSVHMASQLAESSKLSERAEFAVGDALNFRSLKKFDAVISCFLLEHLEHPEKLFENAAYNLLEGGYAFITGALTAAEIDHIFEFRKESDLVNLAEDNGFRVVSLLSEGPLTHPREYFFLPRSMALILQKKRGDIW
ncbi:MAG: class I SAM-dependent methyltransferase [Pseudomonadota bacterium]